jgi:molybdopterin-containing oxidoreductase family membrane subunit
MQDRKDLTDKQINDTLTNSILRTPLHWYILTGFFATIVLLGFVAVGILANRGLGMTGMNRPVYWGFFITNFVFWIGISHAGVMLSAILRLAQAEWRRPATRAAEVLTVFALGTAAMMPIVHLGRMWRFYWVFPYDWARGIWPDIRSPLVWDPHALSTYLIGSSLFIFVALIPDFAVLRDKTSGMAHSIYGALSMGFRGTVRQWRLQAIAGIILSALLLPVFVSVHSIVSWDFGMAMAIPAWHTTIFAPYFVIGAVHSGVAGVITVLILLRWLFKKGTY